MKVNDILSITFQAAVCNNKHTMKAFCEVINEQDNLCRCQLMVIVNKQKMKIGEIFHALARHDMGENAYNIQVRLNDNFSRNFNVKVGKLPEIMFKQTNEGLITHAVLLNWNEHFTAIKKDRNA